MINGAMRGGFMNNPEANGKNHTVLLIEDEPGIAQTITIQLQLVGYTVHHVLNGNDALQSPHLTTCDAIILDWMLPDVEGPELIPQLREITQAPLLMLTARSELIDKLVGLDAGADDYLTKPFDMMELIARIKALIRRSTTQKAAQGAMNTLRLGDVVFNFDTRQAYVQGNPVKLTPTELRLLEILMKTPGKVFTREALIKEVLGYEYEGYGRTLDSHIARLRSKIEKDPKTPRYIITVFGIGYKFGTNE
jgi:DNA-binding response OmpR family regulator